MRSLLFILCFFYSAFGLANFEQSIADCENPQNSDQKQTFKAFFKLFKEPYNAKLCRKIVTKLNGRKKIKFGTWAETIDLKYLSDYKNLKKLALFNSLTLNLIEVGKLVNLEDFQLVKNVSDPENISVISKLTKLKRLTIWNLNISNLNLIKNHTQLEELDLGDANLSYIGALSNLSKLRRLRLGNNNIVDLSPLENLANIEDLFLAGNRISDISAIRNMNKLTSLYIARNSVEKIDAVTNLILLESIAISNNKITDISPLSGLINLRQIYMEHNEIKDLSPIKNLVKLEDVYTKHNNITDASPATGLPNIKLFTLDKKKLVACSPKNTRDIRNGVKCN